MPSGRFSLWIAWRYLFAKKSHNAINILTAISAATIAVGTAALVCVLSVMNGFEGLVESMFSAFDAELRIESAEGKRIAQCDTLIQNIKKIDGIAIISPTIEETALLKYDERQEPAILKGVSEDYEQLTDIKSIIVDGTYRVKSNQTQWVILGAGLQIKLGLLQQFGAPLTIYCPHRQGRLNTLRPEQSFNQAGVLMSGSFSVQQTSYDDRYALISIDLARDIFEYDSTEVTALEIRLRPGTALTATQSKIRQSIGENYKVLNRYEQQSDFFRIMKIEKWLTFLLLSFILLIATFNVIGSLSLLRIEKTPDTATLRFLGAPPQTIRRIFIYEGWLITLLGAGAGIVLGIIVCLIQQHFGIITYGNSEMFIEQAYPVDIRFVDMIATAALVAVLGFLSSLAANSQTKK